MREILILYYSRHGATLEAIPTGLHQRVSVMLGSRGEVERLQQMHAEALHPA